MVHVGDVGGETCGCVGVGEEADVGEGVAEGCGRDLVLRCLGDGVGGMECTVWEEDDCFGGGVIGWFGYVGW